MLPDFIDANVEILATDWVEQAQRLGASALSARALDVSARRLLKALAEDIRDAQNAAQQLATGGGECPLNVLDVTREARRHADDRLAQGFSVNDMVAEYRALRASVVRRWLNTDSDDDPRRLTDLVRFNEAVDQALNEAVERYAAGLARIQDLFVGILAHDLRTPLGAMAMAAQLLMHMDDLPAQALRTTATIERSGARMQRMLDDLTDFTRTRLGGLLPIHIGPTNLGNVCRQAITEIQALYPDQTVRWVSDGDLMGSWDACRLGQLLTNLLENAIGHGQPGADVLVTTRGLDHTVELSVFNEGAPIPLAARQAIFDPLTRAPPDADPRQVGTGLGLGLFIARQIVWAHGGTLEVNSDDSGTTFTASLPRMPSQDALELTIPTVVAGSRWS
ncbi:hypothetical protein WI90_20905 [Burkholderia ubonensis]|uniref:sensor histidine kinase n=1 Tax=Burkholderia ubonensis TaxID=101571 RepID=UPI000756850A|nr:sensor histidine kinase [Burkholderia ubonensis]KVD88270.1 hypothetical protein WI90_20905 [Burkholderia ubonensis]